MQRAISTFGKAQGEADKESTAAYSPRLAKPRHLPLISNPTLVAELGKMLLCSCPTVFLECYIRSRGVSAFVLDQSNQIPQFHTNNDPGDPNCSNTNTHNT